MAQNNQVFAHFSNTIGKLDSLISQLEINVGSAHSVSPFAGVLPSQAVSQVQEATQVATEKLTEKPAKKTEKVAKKTPENKEESKEEKTEKPAKKAEKNISAKNEEKPAKKEEKPAKKEEKPAKKEDHEEKAEAAVPTEEDFQKVDIRVGRIVECWKHPESENLYCEKIDIGTEVRQIASGLQKFQPIENMTGLVLVMANLKVRKLAGFDSNGMVVCASNSDHTKVEILRPPADSKVGERVFLEGQEAKYPQELQPVLNPKKKILENVMPGFKTDADCNATFLGQKWSTSTGIVKAQTLSGSSIS